VFWLLSTRYLRLPSSDVHLKRSGGSPRAAPLLVKPRYLLDEVRERLLGYGQPCLTKVVAKKVEAALDPADGSGRIEIAFCFESQDFCGYRCSISSAIGAQSSFVSAAGLFRRILQAANCIGPT